MSGASEPGSEDVPNEDWWGATSSAIVVLDGVTIPGGMERTCRHGTPWYVNQLGGRLMTSMSVWNTTLADMLGRAIQDVSYLHGECFPDSLGAPSAAVAMLRIDGDRAEYLVLADVTIALETAGKVEVITDDRVEASTAGVARSEPAAGLLIAGRRAEHRNQLGGYWVAAGGTGAMDVAGHAITGSIEGVRRAAVMTDGAALIHTMGGTAWTHVMRMHPSVLISRVREYEGADVERARWPRWKVSDDATAVTWQA